MAIEISVNQHVQRVLQQGTPFLLRQASEVGATVLQRSVIARSRIVDRQRLAGRGIVAVAGMQAVRVEEGDRSGRSCRVDRARYQIGLAGDVQFKT